MALNDRKNFEADKAKVEKWITETDEHIQEEPDLECPLPKLKEIHIFYQGMFYPRPPFIGNLQKRANILFLCSSWNDIYMTISTEYFEYLTV